MRKELAANVVDQMLTEVHHDKPLHDGGPAIPQIDRQHPKDGASQAVGVPRDDIEVDDSAQQDRADQPQIQC